MKELLIIAVGSALVNNVVLSQFLGICPFLGVSKKIETAAGMGGAVVFVITIASFITGAIYQFILHPAGFEYLQTIVFILVIAALVQFVEMFLKKVMPPLYNALGVYLPLITTNCAVLGVSLNCVTKGYNILEGVVYGFSTAVGFTIAIVIMAGIREKIEYRGMKDIKVEFPIIDDVSMKVANLYGMIQPGESQTAAVRAVFFVDPEGKLRAMIYYPLALGRNFEEIKRVLVGLQSIDAFGVAMPADWRPGDEVIVPMQGEDMDDQPEGVKCYDWFFCTRPLPKEEIEKKLGKGIAIKG